jgi:hypothetical protein
VVRGTWRTGGTGGGACCTRAAGPLAQALQLARLREDEQRKDRNPEERSEGRDRTDLCERVRKR